MRNSEEKKLYHRRAQIKEVGSGNAGCGKTESVEVGKDSWWDGARGKVKNGRWEGWGECGSGKMD
jgi:hypothetical protein